MPDDMRNMHMKELQMRAKQMGITGRSKMNKQQLMDAMNKGKM
jgi:transcription termination factor Rho